MLSKKNRYTRAEFQAFLGLPGIQTVYNKLGTLKYLPEGHKMGIVVSSKHEKRAVYRNKLRRRIYEGFSGVESPVSGILYASKQSYTLDFQEVKSLFNGLIEKTKQSS